MSEEKMEHSPLPWGEHLVDEVQVVSRVGEGEEVCAASGDYDHDYERMYANANFIVTACNSYYDNQAAIKELVEATSSLLRHCRHLQNIIPGDNIALFRDMESASKLIAKHKAGA